MLAGSLMTIKHSIKFSLLASLLTALCVKPHQLSIAWLIPSLLSCPRIDTLYLSPQPKGRTNKSDIKSDRPAQQTYCLSSDLFILRMRSICVTLLLENKLAFIFTSEHKLWKDNKLCDNNPVTLFGINFGDNFGKV